MIGKKYVLVCLVLCATVVLLSPASEPEILSEDYINFFTGSITDKVEIMSRMNAENPVSAELARESLYFIIETEPRIGSGYGLQDLAKVSVPFFKITAPDQAELLWSICMLFSNNDIYTLVFQRFQSSDSSYTVPYLKRIHTFIAEAIASEQFNSSSCLEAVKLLESAPDPASFDILFRIVNAGYSPELTEIADNALETVIPLSQTVIVQFMKDTSSGLQEKLFLFTKIVENQKIPSYFKAELAEIALSGTIIQYESSREDDFVRSRLQLAAIHEITDMAWTRAAATVVQYFPIACSDFDADIITEDEFIGVIECLEKFAVKPSVTVLIDYLVTLNSKMEAAPDSINEPVLLAVINALGVLGDKTAFDNLLYVTYMPYSDTVITAARNALAGLKW